MRKITGFLRSYSNYRYSSRAHYRKAATYTSRGGRLAPVTNLPLDITERLGGLLLQDEGLNVRIKRLRRRTTASARKPWSGGSCLMW